MEITGEMTDSELKHWQDRQMEQCRVENIINHLLETYENLGRDTGLDPDRRPNLEESAILMAIREHGLRQNQLCLRQTDEMHSNATRSALEPLCSLNYYCNGRGESSSSSRSHTIPQSSNQNIVQRVQGPERQEEQCSFSIPQYTGGFIDESDTDDSSHNEAETILEKAVSAAIQNQGLGLSGLDR